MKSIFCLPVVFALLPTIEFNSNIPVIPIGPGTKIDFSFKNKFDEIVVSPFKSFDQGDSYMYGKVSFDKQCSATLKIYAYKATFPNKVELYSITKNSRSIEFSYTYDSRYNMVGCYLIFSCTNCSDVTYFPIYATRPTFTPETYDLVKEDNPTIARYFNDKWNYSNEDLKFTNLDPSYYVSHFHKLDLSDLKIYSPFNEGKFPFIESASLFIDDYNSLFSELGESVQKGKRRYLPLRMEYSHTKDKGFYFVVDTQMYVHRLTLEMSSVQKEDYYPTRHIYLPRNYFREQENFTFSITVFGLGFNASYFSHSFNYSALNNLVGSERSSKYSVGSGKTDPDYELGEVVIHS